MKAVRLAELLSPGSAERCAELCLSADNLEAVAADLGDLDRCLALVSQVFEVKGVPGSSSGAEDAEEYRSVMLGIAARLGARRSVLGPEAAAPRPLLRRPAPAGSHERPDLGLVLAYAPRGDDGGGALAALVDLSLWPADGRVKLPGARSKPGEPSRPYMLNLCVASAYRRRGLARKLLALSERLVGEIWGDSELFLHVEDDKLPANALYEATGYVALGYTYDPECPYTKEEAKVLRRVTWRRKRLPTPHPSAARLEARFEVEAEHKDMLPDEDAEVAEDSGSSDVVGDAGKDDDDAPAQPYEEPAADTEDYSWLSKLIK